VVNQLLTEIDGKEELQDVAVIAATQPWQTYSTRHCSTRRFDRHVKIEEPDEKGRLEIFKSPHQQRSTGR
jgi:transitional endoplasmic reticulum ATPase